MCPSAVGGDRMALVMIRIKEALRGSPLDHLSQFPPQVHRILHTEAESLSAHRVVHVRRVARQEDSSRPVGLCLACRVGEPGDPSGIVDPEVGPVHVEERPAQIAEGWLGARPDLLFSHDDPKCPPILQPVESMDARGVVPNAVWGFLGHLDLGDEAASGRIPPREPDTGCLTCGASSPVTTDEILRPEQIPVR